jgi:hypothetical protein
MNIQARHVKNLHSWAGGIADVIEFWSSKLEGLSTNPSTTKKKKKKPTSFLLIGTSYICTFFILVVRSIPAIVIGAHTYAYIHLSIYLSIYLNTPGR